MSVPGSTNKNSANFAYYSEVSGAGYMNEVRGGIKFTISAVGRRNLNSEIIPFIPRLIFSSDNTTAFSFKGTTHKKEKWYLMPGPGSINKNNAQFSYYNEVGGADHTNGVRGRIMFTISAVGSLTSLLIMVEREIPVSTYPSCIIRMFIEYL